MRVSRSCGRVDGRGVVIDDHRSRAFGRWPGSRKQEADRGQQVAGIERRRVLAAGGGVALTAVLASACGSNTGRGGGGSGAGLSQWYHQYGEPGTERAVKRYAAAYKKAHVSVQWR